MRPTNPKLPRNLWLEIEANHQQADYVYTAKVGAMFHFDFNGPQAIENVLRVMLAFVLAMPLAWERGRRGASTALRTFPIVAMASCGYALIVKQSPGDGGEVQARLLQGLIAGIGFIGGGAVVREGTSVRGVATAASIWNTGAIGASIAFQREEIAVVLAVVNFLTLLILARTPDENPESGLQQDEVE